MSWTSGGCKKSGASFRHRFTKHNYRTAMLVSLESSDKSFCLRPTRKNGGRSVWFNVVIRRVQMLQKP
eukprot:4178011-Pleurochrysis_carterae.AAC.2